MFKQVKNYLSKMLIEKIVENIVYNSQFYILKNKFYLRVLIEVTHDLINLKL